MLETGWKWFVFFFLKLFGSREAFLRRGLTTVNPCSTRLTTRVETRRLEIIIVIIIIIIVVVVIV